MNLYMNTDGTIHDLVFIRTIQMDNKNITVSTKMCLNKSTLEDPTLGKQMHNHGCLELGIQDLSEILGAVCLCSFMRQCSQSQLPCQFA